MSESVQNRELRDLLRSWGFGSYELRALMGRISYFGCGYHNYDCGSDSSYCTPTFTIKGAKERIIKAQRMDDSEAAR